MDAESAVIEAFRQEWGRVVAALIGLTGDWDVAEECAQDAFAKAAKRWPRDGVPRRPGAWLTTVARNRAIDVLRRASREVVWLHEAATLLPGVDDSGGPGSGGFDGHEAVFADDRLRLIFTCCHLCTESTEPRSRNPGVARTCRGSRQPSRIRGNLPEITVSARTRPKPAPHPTRQRRLR